MIEIVFLRNRDEQCWGFTVNENNFAQCTYLRSLNQVPHINFWSCYDKGCIWLVSKYPYAKEKNLISQLPISPELKSSSWLSTVITLHLPVWCCVATRKDKVWSFTAVKVTPFFFLFLCFTEISFIYRIIFVPNYTIGAASPESESHVWRRAELCKSEDSSERRADNGNHSFFWMLVYKII